MDQALDEISRVRECGGASSTPQLLSQPDMVPNGEGRQLVLPAKLSERTSNFFTAVESDFSVERNPDVDVIDVCMREDYDCIAHNCNNGVLMADNKSGTRDNTSRNEIMISDDTSTANFRDEVPSYTVRNADDPDDNECSSAVAQGQDLGTSEKDYSSDDSISHLVEKYILRDFGKLCIWQNLLAVMLISGTGKFSKRQYNIFRDCVNWILTKFIPKEGSPKKMPDYTTTTRTLIPLLRKWAFVNTKMEKSELDLAKSGARARRGNDPKASSTGTEFKVVLPSSWAKFDVSCHFTWSLLKRVSETSSISVREERRVLFSSIEDAPIVKDPGIVLDIDTLVLPDTTDSGTGGCSLLRTYRGPGQILEMNLRDASAIDTQVLSALGAPKGMNRRNVTITATALRSRLVTAAKNRPDPRTGTSQTSLIISERDIRSGSFFGTESVFGLGWKVGDMCTPLQSIPGQMYILVLVHRYVYRHGRSQSVSLLFVPYSFMKRGQDGLIEIQVTSVFSCKVTELFVHTPDPGLKGLPPALFSKKSPRPMYGRLMDGRLYFIDNILLYSDGFSQFKFRQGSAGSVYCISLNLPAELRRSRELVRVLTLTPPGVSTKEGWRSIIDDLVQSSTVGTPAVTTDGEQIVIFTNVVGGTGDYHECSAFSDVTGQNGKAPCHLCFLLRYQGHASVASLYGYTTQISSSYTCFGRTVSRTELIRSNSFSDEELVSMGLSKAADAEKKNSPLVYFYNELKRAKISFSIPLTMDNEPVVDPMFDPYRSTFVAPDHLLAGIAIDVLTVAFKLMPTPRDRRESESLISQLLQLNGLPREAKIYNEGKSGMQTTTISRTFCILLLSVPVFKGMKKRINSRQESTEEGRMDITECVTILELFSKLVGETYWYPKCSVDGGRAVDDFNKEGGTYHMSKLEGIAKRYINMCNIFCRRNVMARKELDKPNLHRLLELYTHSIPALGHVRNFNELVFECAHQPLKRTMAGSNFHDSHIQGIDHAIADDWKRRLSMLVHEFDASSNVSDDIISSVQRLLCGRDPTACRVVQQDGGATSATKSLLLDFPLRNILHPHQYNVSDKKVMDSFSAKYEEKPRWCSKSIST